MKWLPLLLLCLASASSAQPGQGAAQSLPEFKVWPVFTLTVPTGPENTFSFRTVDTAPERWSGFIKFRSGSLQSGDQVVSIEGKLLTDMQPYEGRKLLSFSEPGKKIALEVRQPGSKHIRKAVVVRIDSSEEIQR